MTTRKSPHGRNVRAAYESSTYGMAVGVSRAYLRALTEHQAAALAGNPVALRHAREAHALFALVTPELADQQYVGSEVRRMRARRTIA